MRRRGITLLEVLIAIFIMGIGMLALLTLFPLGALTMAQALKDDRAATCAQNADAIATAYDLSHDPLVIGDVAGGVSNAFVNPDPQQRLGFADLSAGGWMGPSHPVLIDPFYSSLGSQVFGGNGAPQPGIVRRSVSLRNSHPARGLTPLSLAEAVRWFSLPDDIAFQPNGLADTSSGFVSRGNEYTWSIFLRRPRASDQSVVDMKVIVYKKRVLTLLDGETAYANAPAAGMGVSGAAGTGTINLTWPAALERPKIRYGTWVCDVTYDNTNLTHAQFYRVVGYTETGANSLALEVQPPLKHDCTALVVMENVIEVFERGTGRLP